MVGGGATKREIPDPLSMDVEACSSKNQAPKPDLNIAHPSILLFVLWPLTALLQCIVTTPLYLITSLCVFFSLILRTCVLCLRGCRRVEPPTAAQGSSHPDAMRIFFDGCGWAVPFSLGVAQHVRDRYDTSNCKIYAISGGNVAAVCLLLARDPSEVMRELYAPLRSRVCSPNSPLFGYCSSLPDVRAAFEALVPDDVHTIATGRYHAVIAPWPHLGLRLQSSFASKAEFIDACLCSMSLPLFVYRPLLSRHAGWPGLWVDGGLQTLMTPIDHLAHLSIRTFPDPLCRFRHFAVHPPRSFALTPLNALVPATLPTLLRKVEEARTYAASHAGLAAALAAFVRPGSGVTPAATDPAQRKPPSSSSGPKDPAAAAVALTAPAAPVLMAAPVAGTPPLLGPMAGLGFVAPMTGPGCMAPAAGTRGLWVPGPTAGTSSVYLSSHGMMARVPGAAPLALTTWIPPPSTAWIPPPRF